MARREVTILPPDLPPREELAVADAAALRPRAVLGAAVLAEAICAGKVADLVLDQVIFERLRCGEAAWPGVRLTDGRVVGCDFAAADWSAGRLTRVEVADCRFTGWVAAEVELSEVLFRDCKLTDARLLRARFDRCRFEGCDLRGVSFEEANLCDVVFRRCDLREARLVRARTQRIDLRTCRIEGLEVTAGELPGLTIEPAQCAALLHLLGADVRSTDE